MQDMTISNPTMTAPRHDTCAPTCYSRGQHCSKCEASVLTGHRVLYVTSIEIWVDTERAYFASSTT